MRSASIYLYKKIELKPTKSKLTYRETTGRQAISILFKIKHCQKLRA